MVNSNLYRILKNFENSHRNPKNSQHNLSFYQAYYLKNKDDTFAF